MKDVLKVVKPLSNGYYRTSTLGAGTSDNLLASTPYTFQNTTELQGSDNSLISPLFGVDLISVLICDLPGGSSEK